jgi:SAM-dependent methyltransferase
MLTITGRLRYDVVRRLLPADVRTVLEIGCGRGALGSILARQYAYLGIEPDPESFAVAHSLLGPRVRRLREEELEPGVYDLVCAFEVLEHIEADEAALSRWRERVRPGGWLLVSVPAQQRLFGATDVRVGHFRRYDAGDLQDVLTHAGFRDVSLHSYGFPLGYALLHASRLLARRANGSVEDRTAASGRWLQPSPSTAFVRRIVAAPFALAQRPFAATSVGTGLVALARRAPTQRARGAPRSQTA